MSEFVGRSQALSEDGMAAAVEALAVQPAEIWTVMAVETPGWGFLPDRRPQILFERHIFSHLTGGCFDPSDVSNRQPGGYGPGGANQYWRLSQALSLNRVAALQSASWGLAQILGTNFREAGFADVETMAGAMSDSEDAQLAAFVSFLKANALDRHLRNHQWPQFARGYNGSDFAVNRYDVRLAQAYERYSTGPLPDLRVRSAQVYLTFAGLNPGPVDGLLGSRTRAALEIYQRRYGLPVTADAGDATLASLVEEVLTCP